MSDSGDFGEAVYLGVDDVLELHAGIFQCTIQEAAELLRSRSGLEGALARPLWHAHYSGADLAMQAAVLAHGIAETQPFVDGNKRTALAALRTFLLVNGYEVTAPQSERAAWILDVSEGLTIDQLARRIRAYLAPGATR